MLRVLVLLIFPFFVIAGNAAALEFEEPSKASIENQRSNASEFIDRASDSINGAGIQKILKKERSSLSETTNVDLLNFRGIDLPAFMVKSQSNDFMSTIEEAGSKIDEHGNFIPEESPLMILVSLSMPFDAIRLLMVEAGEVGAVVVLRGLHKGDFQATITAMRELSGDDSKTTMVIDPTAFKRFSVTSIPSFVLPIGPMSPCSDEECKAPDYIKARGSVSLKYFLELAVKEGGDYTVEASKWLDRF